MFLDIALPDGRTVAMRRAVPDDAEGIFRLYQAVYEGTYTLPIINLREERRRALEDPDTWWLVDVDEGGNIVGSVIFSVDPAIRCGKVYAAVTHPDFRRGDVMYKTIRHGVDVLLLRDRVVDVIYATTRTKDHGPSGLLRKLGFISLGIFPNVHRLVEYETHGLMAIFHDQAFAARERLPKLIPEVSGFYEIIRRGFGLEPAEIVPVADRLKLYVLKGAQAAETFAAERASGDLLLHFFPFHTPNILLSTENGAVRAFINREGKDGHGVVVGLKIDRESVAHLEHVLDVVFETACELGIEYLELLVDAYAPKHQRAALSAGYLPCAYFPAFEVLPSGERRDYLVFARSRAPLNFSNVQMTPRDRQFLDVYLRNTEFRNLVVQMSGGVGTWEDDDR
ncbi:MAG: hypothetical protein FJZ01_09210 [Candidatus Sericytochromatia bacterium]|nr:hypothetical protein [Candidatus Tanganyikabacteria bacterium]